MFHILKTLGFLFLLCSLSCKNEVNLNAPAKDMLVVYGVLNPDANIQYIRVSRIFLPETDAVNYAGANDQTLSEAQAEVRINGVLLHDTVLNRTAGVFPAGQNLFYVTQNELQIQPETKYNLEVKYLPNSGANISSYTYVPKKPEIISPYSPYFSGGGTNVANRAVDFENSPKITFAKSQYAAGYELRAYFRFYENGIERNVVYGPQIFAKSTNCTSPTDICYGLKKREVIDYLKSVLISNPSPNYYTVIDTPVNVPLAEAFRLNTSNRISVTAVDSFLYLYMVANNSNSSTLATSTLEYTNIQNGVGVFGAFAENSTHVDFTQCGKYLLRFNNTSKPAGVCND